LDSGTDMLKVLQARFQRRSSFERPPSAVDDELRVVVAAARGGDAKALRTLLVRLGPPMLQVIRRVLGAHHSDVEDTLQEATLAFVHALPGFRGDCTAQHFSCRIATLTAISAYRRRSGTRDARHELAEAQVVDCDEVPGQGEGAQIVALRRRQLVRQLLKDLPDAQAEALVLHCLAGLTVAELAGSMGVPRETARSRLRLAKAALRKRIAGDPDIVDLLEDMA
jgi:RNA polymerase sigma factor (sigma-70 family)